MTTATTDRMDKCLAEAVVLESNNHGGELGWWSSMAGNRGMLLFSEKDRHPQPGVPLYEQQTAQELACRLLCDSGRKVRGYIRKRLVELFRSSQPEVEAALIWMVLHSRPRGKVPEPVQSTLVNKFNGGEVNWAMKTLIELVIDPLMESPQWIKRCHEARSKFGFDFQDDAPSYVWEKIHRYKYQGKCLGAWMNKTLKNYYLQVNRKHKQGIRLSQVIKSREEGMTEKEREEWFKNNGAPAASKTRTVQFSKRKMLEAACAKIAASHDSWGDDELAAMRGWDTLDAMIITIDTGLWKKIPSAIRNGWMKSCGVSVKSKVESVLASPIPKRRAALAAILGITRNTLDQRWRRSVTQLVELPWVKFTMEAAEHRLKKKLRCD